MAAKNVEKKILIKNMDITKVYFPPFTICLAGGKSGLKEGRICIFSQDVKKTLILTNLMRDPQLKYEIGHCR